jgi:hypothetical protein
LETKYVFAILAVVFVLLGVVRLARDRGRWHPQRRTWLLIGAIFAAVSAWLWFVRTGSA